MKFDFDAEIDPKFHVRIDNREQDRVGRMVKAFENHECSTSVEQLSVGDYVFDDKVVFEYKTIADFISSINSRRVHNQALDQVSCFPYHFVMVVGNEKDLKDQLNKLYWIGVNFNIDQYYGAIARLNTFTTVITAPSEKVAVQVMVKQASKCLDGKVLHKELQCKTANPAYNYLISSVKGLGAKTTQLVVDELDLYSLQDLLTLDFEGLTAIKGVGDVTARLILKATVGE